MPSHHFHDFCERLCECLGQRAPELASGEAQPPAFTVEVRGVPIGFMQANATDEAHGVLMVDYGPLPPERQGELLLSLMHANFLMLGARAPAFGLDPASGHVVCHAGFAVSQADAARFAASLAPLAEGVLRRREDASAPAGAAAPELDLAALGRFA